MIIRQSQIQKGTKLWINTNAANTWEGRVKEDDVQSLKSKENIIQEFRTLKMTVSPSTVDTPQVSTILPLLK